MSSLKVTRESTYRGALRLETRGLTRRGRSARTIANARMGTSYRTKVQTYEAFDTWLVSSYGLESRPLEKKENT